MARKTMVSDTKINVNMPINIKLALGLVASKTGVSLSDVVRMMIYEALQARSDYAEILVEADKIVESSLYTRKE